MEIPEELAQRILSYLATKPFVEVFQMINDLNRIAQAELNKKPKEDGDVGITG